MCGSYISSFTITFFIKRWNRIILRDVLMTRHLLIYDKCVTRIIFIIKSNVRLLQFNTNTNLCEKYERQVLAKLCQMLEQIKERQECVAWAYCLKLRQESDRGMCESKLRQLTPCPLCVLFLTNFLREN